MKKRQVRFDWMKAHVGIPRNERPDQQAKLHTQAVGPEVLTDGGIDLRSSLRVGLSNS